MATDTPRYCPRCGALVTQRERRPNGNSQCAFGHTFPSASEAATDAAKHTFDPRVYPIATVVFDHGGGGEGAPTGDDSPRVVASIDYANLRRAMVRVRGTLSEHRRSSSFPDYAMTGTDVDAVLAFIDDALARTPAV